MNVMMLLEMAAQGFGDRVAFTNGDESLTYQELYDAAGSAADGIKQSGCEYLQHPALLDMPPWLLQARRLRSADRADVPPGLSI